MLRALDMAPPPPGLMPGLAPELPHGLPPGLAGLSADSRQIRPGMLYAALPGSRVDGRAFIADAVGRGAAAVLAPLGTTWPDGVPPRPLILHAEPRRALARLAALHAGPQPREIAAITGTNGKTSTADFLRQLLTGGGLASASIGTLGVIGPDGAGQPGLTTPDPVSLAATLAALARSGVVAAALEASSHGLDQFRLDGVAISCAGFSNLTRDHLDYHGSLDSYRAAKLRLFSDLLPPGAPAFAPSDLEAATADALRGIAARRGLRFALVEPPASVEPHGAGQTLRLRSGRVVEFPVPGRFQVDNALLAAALAEAMGLHDPLALLPRLTGVRGRMELAATVNGAAAFVDYAHTPDALERLLGALRPHVAGRLVLVFGAGGDRDAGKRPLMGAVAARLADIAIVTDDNPRGEDPAAIRAAIRAACPAAREIGDRASAIEAGLSLLRPGDVLAVAGKGHESGQTTNGVTTPFDDAAVIRHLAGA